MQVRRGGALSVCALRLDGALRVAASGGFWPRVCSGCAHRYGRAAGGGLRGERGAASDPREKRAAWDVSREGGRAGVRARSGRSGSLARPRPASGVGPWAGAGARAAALRARPARAGVERHPVALTRTQVVGGPRLPLTTHPKLRFYLSFFFFYLLGMSGTLVVQGGICRNRSLNS